jgi:tetratricopeptide (TPR) repeat protein
MRYGTTVAPRDSPVSDPLLVTWYAKLPQPRAGDDPDLMKAGLQSAMRKFGDAVAARYTEGTLQRLLGSGPVPSRRAAALALGLVGGMASNPVLATALRDADDLVRKFAADAMWEVWLRGGTADQNRRLQSALSQPDAAQTLTALDALVRSAPDFAEAYNQRAIVHYRRGEFARGVADCETVLRLNPHHFGAAAGMGQCYVRMNKPKAAVRAFQQALDINPELDDLKETISALKRVIEGRERE